MSASHAEFPKPHIFRYNGSWFVLQNPDALRGNNREAIVFAHRMNGWKS